MKHKFFTLLLSVLMSMAASVASAHDFVAGGIYYTITSYTSPLTVAVTYRGSSWSEYSNEYMGSVTIPSSVTHNGKTYSVTSIGEYAFVECTGLTSVTIPNSVTSIGDGAFRACSGLASLVVENGNIVYDSRGNCNAIIETATNTLIGGSKRTIIPNSVTSIGDKAFSGCSGLTSITIPNSVTSIGSYAFSNCSGLTSITIPNSVTSIGEYAFYYCSDLTSVTIGNSVASIGQNAFGDCDKLTKAEFASIESLCGIQFRGYYANPLHYAHHLYIEGSEVTDLVIPNSVTSIGNSAFQGCNGLTSVTIPNSVTSIGESAFGGCRGLTTINIPNSVTSIGNRAFSGCTGLTSVTIPNSVTSIGDGAFSNCSGLASVTIGNSVTSIGSNAFNGCSGLTSVTIGNSVTSIGSNAFNGCSGLTSVTIGNSVTSIGEKAFSGCCGLTSITIPNSVTSIGNGAFSGCSGLISVTIGNSVTSIWSGNPFSDCNAIEHLDLNCPTIVNWFSSSKTIKEVIIGNSVTTIGTNAFQNCRGLTSVTIGNSVTNIGSNAFNGCSDLTKVEFASIEHYLNGISFDGGFGSSANPLYYAHHLYIEGSEVTDLVIPNSVTSIGNSAFWGCSGLTSVTIPNSVTSIGESAFGGCSKLVKAEFASIESLCGIQFSSYYANPLSYAHHLYIDGREITDIVIPSTVKIIRNSAFSGCSGLTSVTIPNSVTSIGDGAFKGCRLIEHLDLNCRKIDNWFSSSKTSIKEVIIGEDVAEINNEAFSECENLELLVLDCKNIPNIFGDSRSSLKEVRIGTGVENIEEDTFKDFTALQRCSFGSVEGLLNIQFGDEYANPLHITKELNIDEEVVTELKIPESVSSINDYALYNCSSVKKVTDGRNVTSIGKNAFYNNTKLTSVHIGGMVETIGDYAFYGCPMTSIYNYAEYPQNCGSNVFSIVKAYCKLFVLPESVDIYRVHKDWYGFNIMAMDEEAVGIESIENEIMRNKENEKGIYDLSGRKVSNNGQLTMDNGKLKKGIYIVNGKKTIVK